jgi:ABC-2 type transport system ATP-binding protein
MIRLEHLSKRFAGRVAVEDLNLRIGRGEVCGLLGHNGAGKSTTLGLILGHVHPDAGGAFVCGHSVRRDRVAALEKVGAIFETPGFYEYLSGWDNLAIFASCRGIRSREAIGRAAEAVGLGGRIQERVGRYSHGMRQRLALAQALLPEPELLVLDEPVEGLDPEGIQEIRSIISGLVRERGVTVLLSSHLLPEVEQLCDRVVILREGRIVFDGRWADAAARSGECRLVVDDWAKAARVLAALGVQTRADSVISCTDGCEVPDVVAALVNAGVRIQAVERIAPTLEEFYLGNHAGGGAAAAKKP